MESSSEMTNIQDAGDPGVMSTTRLAILRFSTRAGRSILDMHRSRNLATAKMVRTPGKLRQTIIPGNPFHGHATMISRGVQVWHDRRTTMIK